MYPLGEKKSSSSSFSETEVLYKIRNFFINKIFVNR